MHNFQSKTQGNHCKDRLLRKKEKEIIVANKKCIIQVFKMLDMMFMVEEVLNLIYMGTAFRMIKHMEL